MHIVVVEQNSSGGMIHYAYQLCTALSEMGGKVTLITAQDYELQDFPHNFQIDNRLHLWELFDPQSNQEGPGNPLASLLKKTKWLFRRGIRAVRLIYMWMKLTRYLIKLKPDVVQFGKINFPFEAFFLTHLRKKGLVLTQINHEFERRESTGYLSRWIDKQYSTVYKNFLAIFFHANENLTRFRKLFHVSNGVTHIIPHGNQGFLLTQAASMKNPTDFRERYHIETDDPVVLFFGVLAPSKGLIDLIEAFPSVSRESSAKLLIVGYPSKHINLTEIREKLTNLNLNDNVILDPRYLPLNEISSLMKLATVVVFPYHSSTQSGSLQIAYTFGRPVIATNVGGLPEVIEDGQSGFLVPVRSPEILAEKILSLVNNPSLAAKMGDHAQRLSETRFNWNLIATRILKVYKSILESESSKENANNKKLRIR